MMCHKQMTDLERAQWNLSCSERTAHDRAIHLVFIYSAVFGGLVVYLVMRFL